MSTTLDLPFSSGQHRTNRLLTNLRPRRFRKYINDAVNEVHFQAHDDAQLERVNEELLPIEERNDFMTGEEFSLTLEKWEKEDFERDFGQSKLTIAELADEAATQESIERFYDGDYDYRQPDFIDEAINGDAAEYALKNLGY